MSRRPDDKPEERRNSYKAAMDTAEARRRREDGLIEIRKNKRAENLSRKRRGDVLHPSWNIDPGQVPARRPLVERAQLGEELKAMPELVDMIFSSNDVASQLDATIQIRKLLSVEQNPIFDEIVNSGVVPWFVKFLERDDFPELQFEASWALTNILSGTSQHTKLVIDQGAVQLLVRLLSSPNEDVREQVVWALGNVAGDSSECRDLVLRHGALTGFLAQLNGDPNPSMLCNAIWAISNLCKGNDPKPDFEQIRPALPTLARSMATDDEEVLIDSCWALSYLSDGATQDQIQAVIDAGVCRRLVELLLHHSTSVLIPALRAVGNIVLGDDVQAQVMIDHHVLPFLQNLLTDDNDESKIKKEACWTISNITAGNKEQIQEVIENGIITPVVELCLNAEFEVKKEAAWAISNAICGGTHEQIKILVSQGCIKPLCDLLVCSDPKLILVCLIALKNILEVGEVEKNLGDTGSVNVFAKMIVEGNGRDKIENLQSRGDDNEISEMAMKIVGTYWLEEDDDQKEMPSAGGSQ
ncbi:OLC1v1009040C1 [Oldenlandia corymbosa var. corymbosa]|uniref:Importin subunit alpha n=1 Tax=Oldenlandia corymbosa var. corymbosa TaxID=529605 RepID=A0AAV1DMX6_OLDCO|nr:OLC1v1009040C1 [Oldenlandia corymbosa var. corymbosa]